MNTTILIIEDDVSIRRVVEAYLQQEGYHVITATDGTIGLALAQQAKPDLIVLDLMLPGIDGLEIARRLRTHSDPTVAGVYILMLTARVEETDRVVGLELGADDYVTKPFSPRELVARIRAAARRLGAVTSSRENQILTSGVLRLDPIYRMLHLEGKQIELTTTEFDLLHHFMLHPGRPFSRSDLLDITQTDAIGDVAAYERTIDVHVKNLRQKLGETGRHSRFIETVHGIGYRFMQSNE